MRKYLLVGFGILAAIVTIIGFWLFHVISNLPDVSSLKHYRPPAAADILDKNGQLLANYYDTKYRIWVPIHDIPDIMVQAVVTAEDDTFFEHKGVNYKATWNALMHDVHQHRFSRGGSTITQQMIKNVLLSKEKTISRKIREYILATKAEEILTKRQILEIYLNEVEWGENIYGIEAASRFYLDKHVADVTVAEAALLAGMLPNPRYYNPYKRMEKARERQERVLFNMQQAKLITQDEYEAALSAPLLLRQEGSGRLYIPNAMTGHARPCYEHALEQALLTVFSDNSLHLSGSIIRTTLDKSLQTELDKDTSLFPDKAADMNDGVLIVKQNGQIRAFVCGTSKEKEISAMLVSLGPVYSGYEVSVSSPESIGRDEIILPPEIKHDESSH
ncbi:MAG TPA: transglycosylase domain-containing protein [Nitrospirota bacterium]|nr:transglycosylase domain-containing protein [Nitrospirota bacterium]